MYVSGILYYVSSTINPILYNLMSLKYRQVPPREIELAILEMNKILKRHCSKADLSVHPGMGKFLLKSNKVPILRNFLVVKFHLKRNLVP